MTNKSQEFGAQGTLQRGKACLRCRQVYWYSFLINQFNSSFCQETKDGKKNCSFLDFSPFNISRICIIRDVTAWSPLVNSARRPRKLMGVSMTMERARLALKYFARLLSNSSIGSESLKIRNMCQLLSHYTTPTFIRAPILHPRPSALLKAHTFQFLILLFLPVRGRNLLTSNKLIVTQIRRHHRGHGPKHRWAFLIKSHQIAWTYLVSSEVPALSFIDILYSWGFL